MAHTTKWNRTKRAQQARMFLILHNTNCTMRGGMVCTFIPKMCIINRNFNWICNRRCWQVSPRRTVPKQMLATYLGSHKTDACESRATGPWSSRNESASTILDISAVLLQWSLKPWIREMCFSCDNRPKLLNSFPLSVKTTLQKSIFAV